MLSALRAVAEIAARRTYAIFLINKVEERRERGKRVFFFSLAMSQHVACGALALKYFSGPSFANLRERYTMLMKFLSIAV